MHQAWSGWYPSLEALEKGIETARTHPVGTANGAITSHGSVVGSAVVADEEWVVSAAHVLASELQQPGKQVLPTRYSFRYSDGKGVRSHPFTESYCFPEQDLVFLRTDISFSKKDIAPVLPPDLYHELASSYKVLGANVPQANAGCPVTFFGCGHKIVATYLDGKTKEEVEAVQLYSSPVNRFAIGHNFGEKAVGRCFLSQYFPQNPAWKENAPEAFYSWTSYKGPSSVPLLSSALPGDSGGGMFVEKDGSFYLAGITSKTHVGFNWDKGGAEEKRVGTAFASLYSSLGQSSESYLDKVLASVS